MRLHFLNCAFDSHFPSIFPVDFDTEKIVNAMTKARTDVYKLTDDFVSFTNTVAKDILDETKEDKMTVEEVQDYVEDRLLHSKYKETARDYIKEGTEVAN